MSFDVLLSLKLIRFELVQGVQMTTRRKMCQIKGISEAKMEKIKVRFISMTSELSKTYINILEFLAMKFLSN